MKVRRHAPLPNGMAWDARCKSSRSTRWRFSTALPSVKLLVIYRLVALPIVFHTWLPDGCHPVDGYSNDKIGRPAEVGLEVVKLCFGCGVGFMEVWR